MADPSDPMAGDPTSGAASMDDAPSTDDQGTEDQATEDQSGMVLCTVLVSKDGVYTLLKGDEDEGATDEGASGGVEGDMTIPAVGSASSPPAMSDEGSQGQQFDSIGALLKGILDLVKDHEANASGEGTESDNFNAGYSGDAIGAPTTKQQPPANMRT